MSEGSSLAVRILHEHEIRTLVSRQDALDAMRRAFALLDEQAVTVPAVMDLQFPDHQGEAHLKGAHLHGGARWTVKAATGFYDNAARGLASTNGLSLVFSAETGVLDSLLFDNGYLTELRTAAAGALAADLLAPPEIATVALVGAGGQARYQLHALLEVRRPRRVLAWARRGDRAAELCAELGEAYPDVAFESAGELRAAVEAADLVVTTTPARTPLIHASWLRPGAHVTAMGSDSPGKQELAVDVLARADVLVADLPATAALHGELQHGLAAGAVELDRVRTLGAIVRGRVAGRTSADQITVADLVGVGVQDAAIAEVVVERALERDAGERLAL